ncbi:hypothetical protein [Burkholderia ubonensis]|uniref:hypothetical protein n=1 Tax=Burkholderia ubonensis TaxID=101571 RepID=UPI001E28F0D8|nr:hypothetical protein [Burkholderia ubonensis]
MSTDAISTSASGISGVGSNSFGFSMPDGFSAPSSGPSLAGLTGVGSGTSISAPAAGSNSFGFTMPDSSGMAQKLAGGLGAASKALSVPPPTNAPSVSGGSAAVRLQEQNFTAPVVDFVAAPGSVGGNGLLQLLQKYRPGITG